MKVINRLLMYFRLSCRVDLVRKGKRVGQENQDRGGFRESLVFLVLRVWMVSQDNQDEQVHLVKK